MKSTRLSLTPKSEFVNPLWSALLCGADGDEDGNDGGQSGSGGTGDDAGDDADKDKSKDDPAQKKIAALNEEKDRHWEAARKAEKERDDALALLKEIEDKGKDAATLQAERLKELESSTSTLSERNKGLALENAFLKDNTFKWQSADVALRLADLSNVKIDDKGKVTGLKEALEALATSSPFLLVPESKEEEEKKPAPRSGDAPGSKKKPEGKAAQEAALRQKYPALRR